MRKNLSAIKKNQLSLRNRSRNKIYKSAIKNSIKKFILNINQSNVENIMHDLSIVYKKIDKAVKKGVIHKNMAARKKSRLCKILKSN
uniref:Ribosomal protein S20 n=1 Tax=Compsothamnion thuioides TaxID=3097386 RepID=A0A4D6WPB4_9FLOR|nr:ribosomal protein S20 [Compsothamnion thuyoides]